MPGGYPTYGPGSGPQVAGMGQRFVARLIDGVIIGVVSSILGVILLGGSLTAVHTDQATGRTTGLGAVTGATFGWAALILALSLLYEIGLIATRGATLGKRVMHVRVVQEATGQLPGWGPATLRWLIPVVGSLVCGVGQLVVYLSPFFDGTHRNQGWHDKVAKTLVVQA